MQSRVLVTGGAGFIGSHTCLVLLGAGHDLLILDNFSNSSPEALTRVASLANVPLDNQRLEIQQGDIRDPHTLDQLFSNAGPAVVPLMPSFISPGSKRLENPSKNHSCTGCQRRWLRTLLAAMDAHACRTLVQQQRHGLRLRSRPTLNRHLFNRSTPTAFQSCG